MTSIVQPTLAKLDANFQIEWIRHFGRAASWSATVELWDIQPTSDGHYIGAGETGILSPDDPVLRVGWLYKFSAEGDSIWSRQDYPPLPVYFANAGFLTAVGELSSGSIVAAGGAFEGADYSGWLVKVSADGCLVDTLCVLPTATGELLLPKAEARLYPNPTNGQFTLDWPGGHLGTKARFTMLDSRGREVWREVRVLGLKMAFNLVDLVAGLYFLSVETEEGRWVRKLVVE